MVQTFKDAAVRADSERSGGDAGRLPALDGWRGVAVLLVLVGHLWPRTLPGGFIGVSVFFALSGYLITSLLLQEADGSGNRVALGRFWSRRIRRLAPLALTVLMLSLLATRLWPQTSGGAKEFFAALTHWLNLYYVAEGATYGQDTAGPSTIQHYWSLSIEEQFYIVYPLLAAAVFWVARKRGWSNRVLLAIPLAVVTGLSVGLGQMVAPGTAYFRSELRIGEIAIGCLAALWFPLSRPSVWVGDSVLVDSKGLSNSDAASGWSSPWAADAVGALGLGGVVGSAIVLSVDEPKLYAFGFSLIALASVMVIWALPRGRLVPAALAAPALVWTGRISYGIYLLHWPLLVFSQRALPNVDESIRSIGVLAATVGLAAASHRFVEMPIRRGGLTSRPLIAYVGALTAVVGALLLTPPVVDSFNFTSQVTDDAAAEPVPEGAVKAVVLGDSVLWTAMYSMPLIDDDLYVMRALIPGCPFLPDVEGLDGRQELIPTLANAGACVNWGKTMAKYANRDPDVIMFSTGYSMARARISPDGDACDADFEEWYTPRLKATVNSLARVAPVLALLPHRSFLTQFYLDRGYADHRDMLMCIRRIQAGVFAEIEGVRVIDTETYLCPNGVKDCQPDELPDGVHFDRREAESVQAWLKEIMVEAGS